MGFYVWELLGGFTSSHAQQHARGNPGTVTLKQSPAEANVIDFNYAGKLCVVALALMTTANEL